MTQLSTLDDAQVLLLATFLATESDLRRLQVLAAERQDVLTPQILYRILLTYLPANYETQDALITFLQHSVNNFNNVSTLDVALDTSIVSNVPPHETHNRLHEIRLGRIEENQEHREQVFVNFLIQWTHQLDARSGLVPSLLRLIDIFSDNRKDLKHWQSTYLKPLVVLQNELYPGEADTINLAILENIHGRDGVNALLQFAKRAGQNTSIGKDLRLVVTPWIQGLTSPEDAETQRFSNSVERTSWQDVNCWIFATSSDDFNLAAKAVFEWSGPFGDEIGTSAEQEIQLCYIQTMLALMVKSSHTLPDPNNVLSRLLDRAASLYAESVSLPRPSDRTTLVAAARSDLSEDQLLSPLNPITTPSEETFELYRSCLIAQELFNEIQLSMSISSLFDITLFGSEERQKQELGHFLQQVPQLTRIDVDWRRIREHLLFLHGSQIDNRPDTMQFPVLGRITTEYLESQILDAILSGGQYQIVREIYLEPAIPPLHSSTVKEHIVKAILGAYDNASNGNRTRGGIKRASELLKAFSPSFPKDQTLISIEHLLKATHSLSFYQLTLRHEVPFQPVNVRTHQNSLALIGKVLEQNTKAYTQLDDLIDIGRNLILARQVLNQDSELLEKSEAENLFDAKHRVTFLAISSALQEHDFDTAYSYITTRLSTNPSQASSAPFADDTSWRAAYAAGKYRPLTPPKSLHDRITSLSKRMDLLSLALTLAPTPEPLSEILAAWRRSEEELESLKSQAIEEERAFEVQSGGTIPGGFGPGDREIDAVETRNVMEKRGMGAFSVTYEEEAPMGLFDVARGAASAFKKSAFPLNRTSAESGKIRPLSWSATTVASEISSPQGSTAEDETGLPKSRRKRDVVSGIVTGGLVSGMSWVLGAQPVKNEQQQKGEQDSQFNER